MILEPRVVTYRFSESLSKRRRKGLIFQFLKRNARELFWTSNCVRLGYKMEFHSMLKTRIFNSWKKNINEKREKEVIIQQ